MGKGIIEIDLPFLDKVRELYRELLTGKICSVVSDSSDIESVFKNYFEVMKIFLKKGLLVVKSLDMLSEEDLETEFYEF